MADFPLPSNLAVIKRVAGADPAANAEVVDAVPAGKWWMLLGFSVQLVQGATQTPNPQFQIDDGTNILWQSPPFTAAISAATTVQISAAPNLPFQAPGAAATVATIPLPDGFVLPGGFRITTVTAGKGANTNYGAVSYFVCELG